MNQDLLQKTNNVLKSGQSKNLNNYKSNIDSSVNEFCIKDFEYLFVQFISYNASFTLNDIKQFMALIINHKEKLASVEYAFVSKFCHFNEKTNVFNLKVDNIKEYFLNKASNKNNFYRNKR
jgi:antirestriction protein